MARINSRQVEAFRATMLTGSVTEAAALMTVTQPAVSRLLRDLQALLKMELFERRGTGPSCRPPQRWRFIPRSSAPSSASNASRRQPRKSVAAAPARCGSLHFQRCRMAICRGLPDIF
ncbi:hypothetical protein ACVWW2_007619 [Bradyrhizobium sp. LM4.3]